MPGLVVVHVIGGGPAGMYSAYLLAREGVPVTVYEEHTTVGMPDHCTGLISQNLRKFVRDIPVIQRVDGARFFAGREEAFIEKKGVANVVDRPALDRTIYEMALSEGVVVELGRGACWKDFEGKVVAADGATSRTRFDLGQSVEFLPAVQFDLREKTDDFVELWFEPWNPDFFVWVVPRGGYVRVGTAARDFRGLGDFVRRRFGRKRVVARHSGLVIVSGPVKKTYFPLGEREIFLVGDAAGQVKPTTGGGVVMGLESARALADSIVNGRNYEKEWRGRIGRELFLQRIARWLILRDPGAFVRFVRRSRRKLESLGDMDFQFNPRLLPEIARFLLDVLV